MNLIRKATERLEQLERAGVQVPWAVARRKPGTADVLQPREASATALDAKASADSTALPGPAAAPSAREVLKPAHSTTLDLDHLRRASLLVPGDVRSDLAHQFRRLKRPLLENVRGPGLAPGSPRSLVMVTSAVPGEGKTFCAINLAMSMAMEVDTAVLLVDADVVRPSVLSRLGIQARPAGLLDLLTQPGLALDEALISTNIPKLSILPAGKLHEQSTELLASTAMDRLLSRLVTLFADHIVIFDAPPLLPTTESSILASKVGQVVVVVEAMHTLRQSVQQAFGLLRGCPIVLSVLNKSEEPAESRHYGYTPE